MHRKIVHLCDSSREAPYADMAASPRAFCCCQRLRALSMALPSPRATTAVYVKEMAEAILVNVPQSSSQERSAYP